MRDQLLDAFALAFPNVPRTELPLVEWDSLKAVELVLAIEQTFHRSLDLDAIAGFRSFADFERHLISTPKKGLITDLDGTLWTGVLAEREDIQPHVAYRDYLLELANRGILLAIASKNDGAHVNAMVSVSSIFEGFRRKIFPIEVHWGPKSESVARILQTWNVSAKDVVFVDDSPMELAEVSSVFPEIATVPYTTGSIDTLARHFPKRPVTHEDQIRMDSIISGVRFTKESAGRPLHEFLKTVGGTITIEHSWTPRAQELVEKTNQFNLNGVRRSREELLAPHTHVMRASYRDKFGDLGQIAALHGHVDVQTFYIDTFVMSCRAFSRQIEYALLKHIFDQFPVRYISFAHRATKENLAFCRFLEDLGIAGTLTLSRDQCTMEIPHAVTGIPYVTEAR